MEAAPSEVGSREREVAQLEHEYREMRVFVLVLNAVFWLLAIMIAIDEPYGIKWPVAVAGAAIRGGLGLLLLLSARRSMLHGRRGPSQRQKRSPRPGKTPPPPAFGEDLLSR
jgi:hypothetical protein